MASQSLSLFNPNHPKQYGWMKIIESFFFPLSYSYFHIDRQRERRQWPWHSVTVASLMSDNEPLPLSRWLEGLLRRQLLTHAPNSSWKVLSRPKRPNVALTGVTRELLSCVVNATGQWWGHRKWFSSTGGAFNSKWVRDYIKRNIHEVSRRIVDELFYIEAGTNLIFS